MPLVDLSQWVPRQEVIRDEEIMEELDTKLVQRPLHLIWILDCSGGMDGAKIECLNNAMQESIPSLREIEQRNPQAEIFVRAVTFSDGEQWYISKPISVLDLEWQDVTAGGVTDLSAALSLIAGQLSMEKMPKRAVAPVLVLITDGHPTDFFEWGLKEFFDQAWGKKAVRVGIAIGEYADHDILKQFIDHPEFPVLQGNNSNQLINYIKWWQDEIWLHH